MEVWVDELAVTLHAYHSYLTVALIDSEWGRRGESSGWCAELGEEENGKEKSRPSNRPDPVAAEADQAAVKGGGAGRGGGMRGRGSSIE